MVEQRRTQVAIIGAGPAGTLLAQLLHQHGIESIVLERQSRDYVLGRIRAGVLEEGTVNVLRDAGVGTRMDAEGHPHDGTRIVWDGRYALTIDMRRFTGRGFVAYGQTRIQEDLYAARDAAGDPPVFEATDVMVYDVTTSSPRVTYSRGGDNFEVACDHVVGCDGFHGVSRTVIPRDVLAEYEKEYPFGWLGVLSETPPFPDIVYANHPTGFALCSMRNPMLSRYYVQCGLDDRIEDWPDDRFWDVLTSRLTEDVAAAIVTGPSIEKSITPLRSFVAEPMRYANLFLAGDAAHIVPPTGAKGLNLAVSDVYYLSRGFAQLYGGHGSDYLDRYSEMALRRVWGSVRFSWWLTNLLHRYPSQTSFDQRAQEAELDYLASSELAQASMAEQYAGLPFED